MRDGFVAAALAFLPLSTAGAAVAPAIVISAAPERVAVTLYRDRERRPEQELRRDWLNGYALISETRSISLPAGESVIRFEGVAGGILPQSAIVAGLPEDVAERNRDAFLISPSTLLDRSLGQRVHLRRTSRATGEVREQEAVIRSGAGGAVVLQTAEGYEALRCTGQSETIVYDQVPAELSPRPVLSVRTQASAPVTATVTLSYLAGGFDWQANYIVYLSPEGRRADLFAWLTMASVDETTFANADTQAVAGQVNREERTWERREGGSLGLRCWPQGPFEGWGDQNIVVTGSRMAARELSLNFAALSAEMSAEQEDLGDLKLYRIPEPVTIASNSQKQVAFLERQNVRTDLVFRRHGGDTTLSEAVPTPWYLVARNQESAGLGEPLPAGRVVVFALGADRPVLLGLGSILDRAVGEEVEIPMGLAAGVTSRVVRVRQTRNWEEWALVVTNGWSRRIRFEAEFDPNFSAQRRLVTREGHKVWITGVPANGTARLRFRVPR